jgi:hypothetical protein
MKILDCASNSGRWVRGSLENTTDVVLSNSNVTLVTPASSPRVLDKEVVLSVKSTVSDGEDTVIEVGSASGGDDTAGVGLEGELIGFNGNGDWLLGKSRFHLGGGLSNIGECGDGTDTLRFGVRA